MNLLRVDDEFKDIPNNSTTRLSVLVVNSLYAPYVVGGAEVVTEMLARGLAEQGHKASVLTTCSRDQGCDFERSNDVDVYRFFPPNLWWLYERFAPDDRRSALDKLGWRVRDAWNREAGARFSRILERVRPDVVHTHNIKGFSPIIWHLAKQRGIPVVHTGHSYELICADGSLLSQSGESCAPRSRCMICKVHGSWYSRQADNIDVFCSPSDYLLRAHREAGIVLKRSARVRNGVSRQRSAAASGETRSERPIRFLYMGQLASHKGVETLFEAIRLARDASFTIDIGGRGPLAGKLRELAATDRRVRFHGFVEGERKTQLLSSADVLLFPSIWVENAPMSIAEAFCYGLPVIGSRIGAIPEFVEQGVNGLLFEAGNASSLAGCMMELSVRPDEMRRLKEGARKAGDAWPTPEAMASDYVGLYRSSLSRHGTQRWE